MAASIFLNLAITDLQASIRFYTAIGFTQNPNFSDDSAACMVYSENIYVMLLTHARFASFIDKPIADLKREAACINSLSVDSRDLVHDFMKNVLANGGKEPRPFQDHGFMLQRSFEDPDGHNWEVFHMDMSQIPTE